MELNDDDLKILERLHAQGIEADPAYLEELDRTILRKELHNALMNMALEAVESGNVQIESIEDLETVFFLGLLLEIS